MNKHSPDRWVIIKIEGTKVGKPFYKIMASWYGGYCGSDSWQMSSGIESVEYDPIKEQYTMPQSSGSIYKVHKDAWGMSGYTASVYANLEATNSDEVRVSVMDENFDIAAALQE